MFNASIGSLASGVANKIATEMLSNHLSFSAAIGTINFGSAAISAGYSISGAIGGYLGRELVPAKTHEGAVGGQLLGAVGSAVGISIALSNVIGTALGTVLNFIIPGIGSLIGTIVGTLIGDAIGHPAHPAAVDLIDQAGYYYGYNHSSISASDGGDYSIPDPMAAAAVSIVNAYLNAVKGVALDHSKQTMVGYITDPQLYYVSGWVPAGTYRTHLTPDDAVHAAALDILQHTEVIGGDLILKRAHQNSASNIPETQAGSGAPGQAQTTGAGQLATMSGDLAVAQDYENYLNNREAINALIAAYPDSAFAAGWIATFARVNDLKLNQYSSSDFLGGLVGYLDSVNKAGLGAAAANASVKYGNGVSASVEVRVANGAEVPGSLSVFADQVSQRSDATGTTVTFTFGNGFGGNPLWFGGDGGNTFTGTAGHDILVGGAAVDIIHGGNGFDFIEGGGANDYLFGDDGNDILRGGTGPDALYGGKGDDTYVFNRGDGEDAVLDEVNITTTTSGWVDEWRDDDGDGANEFHHDWVTTTTTEHPDAGRDTLVFGPGIRVSDVSVHYGGAAGTDLIVDVRDPANPGAAPTDVVKLLGWGDWRDRVETFVFADGTTLHMGAQFDAYRVPFGATLSGRTVAENSANGTVVGTVAGFDLLYGVALTYSLADNPGGRFAINASTGVITVANNLLLDFESWRSHDITVRTADLAGNYFDKTFTIGVTDLFEAPSGVTLSNSSVAENSAGGTVVGTATGIDTDPHAVLTYALVGNAAGRFAIGASSGVITVGNGALLDYEAAASHAITVRVLDQQGHAFDKPFTIAVTDVYEAPVVDVLWQRQSTGWVASWQFQASQKIGAYDYGAADPARWEIAGTGDVNGDRKSDVVWHAKDNGWIATWELDGAGHKIGAHDYGGADPARWEVAGIGDVNGDHKSDVVWHAKNNGWVATWELDGAGHKTAHDYGGADPARWEIAGIGDVNGDGKSDIIWQAKDNGWIATWELDGAGHKTAHDYGAVDPARWEISKIGDFNGDGKSDILFRAKDNGWVASWELDGAGHHTGRDFGLLELDWHIV